MPTVLVLRIRILIAIMICFLYLNVSGQEISPDRKKERFEVAQQALLDTINNRSIIDFPFVIGREHRQIFNKESHPYFSENEWQKGSLVYNGTTYAVEGLKYDIETDHLIYLHVANNTSVNVMALDENAITEFELFGKTFRYFKYLKNERGKRVKDGYSEVVFDGKLKFLIRWEKKQIISNNAMGYNNASCNMYLLQDDKLILIQNMSQLINQLEVPYRDAVKRYKKENHLKISKTKYMAASDVLHFYENLMEQ